jgi:hypothetical protein
VWKRKRIPRSRASTLALGKICGCGSCKYCKALAHELAVQEMLVMVAHGPDIAKAAREEKLKEWSKSNENL